MNKNQAHAVIIFDLDGTLTKPYLNFDAIRAEMNVTGPILEALDTLDDTRRKEVEAILLHHEERAAVNAILQEGAKEVVDACRSRGYKTALLTRNSRRSVKTILDKYNLLFDTVRTREDGAIKPSPEPALSILNELDGDPQRSYMVGDFLFDIQCGKSAGLRTLLMIGANDAPDFADQADYCIHSLRDLLSYITQPD